MNYRFEDLEMLQEGQSWDKTSPKALLQYAVGGLLYTPGSHATIADDICRKRYPQMTSIVLCLEDAIQETGVALAENQLIASLVRIDGAISEGALTMGELPLIFIRVRSPEQMATLLARINPMRRVVTGFVAPKFEPNNMRQYGAILQQYNTIMQDQPLYLMPILESSSVIALETRQKQLVEMKQYLDTMAQWILNVRVGGNDFCNQLGVRRGKMDTIYDIGVINSVLMDILNVFGRDYLVSAPVWEYFGAPEDSSWQVGLERELHLEKINGFVGKTLIHPSQLPVVQRAMVVTEADYRDALAVDDWQDDVLGVGKSANNRMNEAKVHSRWATRILAMAQVYGVKRG